MERKIGTKNEDILFLSSCKALPTFRCSFYGCLYRCLWLSYIVKRMRAGFIECINKKLLREKHF